MSNLMDNAVINMPYELAMADEISRKQFYSRAQSVLKERDEALAKLVAVEGQNPCAWMNDHCETTIYDKQVDYWKSCGYKISPLYAKPVPADKPAPEHKGWYCAHCQCGVDPSEVTYNESHTVCGRIITDDEAPVRADNQHRCAECGPVYDGTALYCVKCWDDANKPAVAVPDCVSKVCRDWAAHCAAVDEYNRKREEVEKRRKFGDWGGNLNHEFHVMNDTGNAYHEAVRAMISEVTPMLAAAPSHSQQSAYGLLHKAAVALEAVCEFPDSQQSAWEARRNAEDLVVEIVNHLRDRCPSQLNAPRVLNEDTLYILGRPNFWCRTIADRMRSLGHEIPHKSEDEQAHVINLMLDHYERFGSEWRTNLENYLRSKTADRCPSHESEQS